MSGLKQELGLAQGIGLLSTSLLGTGVFAVPALAALVAGNNSLWAWPVLIILVFPIAIVFAILGRHYPSAGGVAHFVGMAFGSRLERVTGWLFLSVIPVGLPAALQIAAGFGQAMFGWHSWQLLLAELGTLALVWYIGTRGASSSANLQTVIAGLIVALIVAIWWAGDIKPANIPFPAPGNIELTGLFAALSVMFWCFVGLEAFAHLASEFKNPERDFPRALMIGLPARFLYCGICGYSFSVKKCTRYGTGFIIICVLSVSGYGNIVKSVWPKKYGVPAVRRGTAKNSPGNRCQIQLDQELKWNHPLLPKTMM